MAVLIETRKYKPFEFKLSEKGRTYKVDAFANFPLERALAQADMTPEQIQADLVGYLLEKCPGLEKEANVPTLFAILEEWRRDSGMLPGE